MKTFISGSRTINKIPTEAKKILDYIINNKFKILVGDAKGVDRLIQEYCYSKQYFNLTVFYIYSKPRNCISNKFKQVRIIPDNKLNFFEQQKEKDRAMTREADFCLVIWDGKSKGSQANIKRAKKYNKRLKVIIA